MVRGADHAHDSNACHDQYFDFTGAARIEVGTVKSDILDAHNDLKLNKESHGREIGVSGFIAASREPLAHMPYCTRGLYAVSPSSD